MRPASREPCGLPVDGTARDLARATATVGQGRASRVCWAAMRFGLFFQAPESVGQTHAERYAEMFHLIALADSLGFDVALDRWPARPRCHEIGCLNRNHRLVILVDQLAK